MTTGAKRMFPGVASLARQPWAIEDTAADVLRSLALTPANAEVPAVLSRQLDTWTASVAAASKTTAGGPPPAFFAAGSVAVINVVGVLDKSDTDVTDASGNRVGTSYDAVDRGIAAALTDESIGSILLRVDSPGGNAVPVDTVAERIFTSARDGARGKPVAAFVENGMGASAAYYLASQASAGLYLTAGAQVGSIGTIMSTVDISELLGRWGVKVTTIKSTPTKDVGSPFRPMSESDRAVLQDMVNRYDAMFVAAVARGRGVPESRVREWQSMRMVEGQRAVAAGMADGVRSSVYQVIAELHSKFPPARRRAG